MFSWGTVAQHQKIAFTRNALLQLGGHAGRQLLSDREWHRRSQGFAWFAHD
jgi:hypothetical protein